MGSISFPSHPHGYYSQISSQDRLPVHLEDHVKALQTELQHIQELTQKINPSIDTLTEHFQQFESKLSQFFTELDHSSNRGFESSVKQQFNLAYNLFLDHLNELTDPEGNSLRDALYDPEKFSQTLRRQHPQSHYMQQLSSIVASFSSNLSSTFKI